MECVLLADDVLRGNATSNRNAPAPAEDTPQQDKNIQENLTKMQQLAIDEPALIDNVNIFWPLYLSQPSNGGAPKTVKSFCRFALEQDEAAASQFKIKEYQLFIRANKALPSDFKQQLETANAISTSEASDTATAGTADETVSAPAEISAANVETLSGIERPSNKGKNSVSNVSSKESPPTDATATTNPPDPSEEDPDDNSKVIALIKNLWPTYLETAETPESPTLSVKSFCRFVLQEDEHVQAQFKSIKGLQQFIRKNKALPANFKTQLDAKNAKDAPAVETKDNSDNSLLERVKELWPMYLESKQRQLLTLPGYFKYVLEHDEAAKDEFKTAKGLEDHLRKVDALSTGFKKQLRDANRSKERTLIERVGSLWTVYLESGGEDLLSMKAFYQFVLNEDKNLKTRFRSPSKLEDCLRKIEGLPNGYKKQLQDVNQRNEVKSKEDNFNQDRILKFWPKYLASDQQPAYSVSGFCQFVLSHDTEAKDRFSSAKNLSKYIRKNQSLPEDYKAQMANANKSS